MTTQPTNPSGGNGGGVANGGNGGALSFDEGAAAIGDLDRARDRERPRDEDTGRWTRRRDQSETDQGDDDGYFDDEVEDDDSGDDGYDDENPEADNDADDDGEGESDDEDQRGEPKFKVIVNGEESEVPASELIAGYQRNADYTNKTKALAAERTAVREHGERVVAERHAYTQLLGNVAKFLQEQVPDEQAVHALMMENPVEGFRAKQVRDSVLAKAKEFSDAHAAMIEGAQRQAAHEFRQEMAAALAKLPELIPEWKDPQRESVERRAVLEYALGHFTEAELNDITDPRAMMMLRKAMLYDRRMTRKGEHLKPGGKRATHDHRGSTGQAKRPQRRDMQPGTRVEKHNSRGQSRRAYEQARARAAQSGRPEDVAALLSFSED